jgi:thiamine pyrophosphokinase
MGLRAFIYGGVPVLAEGLTESPKAEDLCIAADSGYQLACRLGQKVDILVGDMDSLGISVPEGTMEVHRLPTEKDLTDVQVAVELAVGRGADEIIIVSSLSGRLDHTLSTLAILEDMRGRGIHAYVTDGQNRARFIRSTSTLIARSQYRYLSLIAADETVKGVSVEGCKYPLKKATLCRRVQFAVSNEITGNVALISVKKGGLYIIESKDR